MAEVLTPPKEKRWGAIRLDAATVDIPYCTLCEERIEIGFIYCESFIAEPIVVCQSCTSEMLDARLALIGQGG